LAFLFAPIDWKGLPKKSLPSPFSKHKRRLTLKSHGYVKSPQQVAN
jgi:hypothetical protein